MLPALRHPLSTQCRERRAPQPSTERACCRGPRRRARPRSIRFTSNQAGARRAPPVAADHLVDLAQRQAALAAAVVLGKRLLELPCGKREGWGRRRRDAGLAQPGGSSAAGADQGCCRVRRAPPGPAAHPRAPPSAARTVPPCRTSRCRSRACRGGCWPPGGRACGAAPLSAWCRSAAQAACPQRTRMPEAEGSGERCGGGSGARAGGRRAQPGGCAGAGAHPDAERGVGGPAVLGPPAERAVDDGHLLLYVCGAGRWVGRRRLEGRVGRWACVHGVVQTAARSPAAASQPPLHPAHPPRWRTGRG